MTIVHVNTYDTAGGAARAMFRLHLAMKGLGADSLVVCGRKACSRGDVIEAGWGSGEAARAGAMAVQEAVFRYLQAGRSGVSDTIFTASAPGAEVADVPELSQASAILLHWVAQYLSPPGLSRLLDLGRPVAWRLSDMWPFTGGCHYDGGCGGHADECQECPQLAPGLCGLPPAILGAKRRALAGRRITVVSPSRWLADVARQSSLFADQRVEVIINGVDDTRFYPEEHAKKRLGLPPDSVCLLFVATHSERRKGFALLREALAGVASTLGGSRLPGGRELRLLCIGDLTEKALDSGVPLVPFGHVDSDDRLRLIYGAADLFAITSVEENLPGTVLEAMACALPVVGFATGGVPDLVQHGRTGLLVPTGDAEALCRAILECLLHPEASRAMGLAGRDRVRGELSVKTQARRYIDLLGDIDPPGDGDARKAIFPGAELGVPRHVLLEALGRENGLSRGMVLHKAFTLRDAGKVTEGRMLLEGLAIHRPSDEEILAALGALLAAEGLADEAVARFRQCIELNPMRLGYYLNVSDAYRYSGRFEEALAALAPLEEGSPEARGLWLKRGQALAGMGRHREAARSLAKEARRHGCPRAIELLTGEFALRNA